MGGGRILKSVASRRETYAQATEGGYTFEATDHWDRLHPDFLVDRQVVIFLDPRSFPLGTGPKPQEIWHEGYYPVAWTNTNYRMVYFNMGHNDIDYAGGSDVELSFTFSDEDQQLLVRNAMRWLGER